MENNRVELRDTMQEAIIKMVDGNPGALHVSMELIKKEEGLGFVHYLKLDDAGIYGPRIWMCYKDMCGEDIEKLYSILKNNSITDAIKEKCQQDSGFAMEWEYYKRGVTNMEESDIRQWVKENAEGLMPEIPLAQEELDHVAMCLHHIWQWYHEGRPLGGFLTAVVRNDFSEACLKADDVNRKALYLYAIFLANKIDLDYRKKAQANKKGGV